MLPRYSRFPFVSLLSRGVPIGRYTDDDALSRLIVRCGSAFFRFSPRGVVVVVFFFDAAYGVRGDFNDELGWCARSACASAS